MQSDAPDVLDQELAASSSNDDESMAELRTLLLGPAEKQIAEVHERLTDPRRQLKEVSHVLPAAIRSRKDDELTDALRETLTTYEPRLDRKTIRVRRDGSVGPEQLKLRFIVHADLKAEPLNVPVEFVADVDLDSGDIQINRL